MKEQMERHVCGIEIISRYGVERELEEMEDFVKLVQYNELNQYLTNEIFYDSKADLCVIELLPREEVSNLSYDYIEEAITHAAILTIGQFAINGVVGHKLAIKIPKSLCLKISA